MAEFLASRWEIGRDPNVSADGEFEFFEHAGDRLVVDGEHAGVNRMRMNDGGDVAMSIQAGEVEADFGRRGSLARRHRSRLIRHDEIVRRHFAVGHGGWRQNNFARGRSHRYIARGSFGQSDAIHFSNDLEDAAPGRFEFDRFFPKTPTHALGFSFGSRRESGSEGPFNSMVLPSGSRR